MPWILLLIAAACFGLTLMKGLPTILTVIFILAALGFMFASILSFLASRLESSRRDDSKMISPEELRMMREQAAARKAAENSDTNSTLN